MVKMDVSPTSPLKDREVITSSIKNLGRILSASAFVLGSNAWTRSSGMIDYFNSKIPCNILS
jgi:hypothetical protein